MEFIPAGDILIKDTNHPVFQEKQEVHTALRTFHEEDLVHGVFM